MTLSPVPFTSWRQFPSLPSRCGMKVNVWVSELAEEWAVAITLHAHIPSATAPDDVTPLAACHAFCQVANLHTQRIPQEEFAQASPRYNILYWPNKEFESSSAQKDNFRVMVCAHVQAKVMVILQTQLVSRAKWAGALVSYLKKLFSLPGSPFRSCLLIETGSVFFSVFFLFYCSLLFPWLLYEALSLS